MSKLEDVHHLGWDKMILRLAALHASTFNIPRQAFFWLNQRVKLFYINRKFLTANIFDNLLFDFRLFINTNFNEIHSWNLLKQTYWKLQVCLSMCDLFATTRH